MNFDINSLLNGNSAANSSSLFDPATIMAPLMPFVIAITVVSVLITLLYIINAINTWRSHRATIEMRNILREMNARDKARNTPPASSEQRSSTPEL